MVMRKEDEEASGINKNDCINEMKICLAGKAAEMVFYNGNEGLTAGPSNDLEHATQIAFRMITRYGMDEDFLISPAVIYPNYLNSPIADKYFKKANDIVKEQLDEAIKIVAENKDIIDKLAHELLNKSRLECDEMKEIIQI
jgi:ATP-dependent Zn proteases